MARIALPLFLWFSGCLQVGSSSSGSPASPSSGSAAAASGGFSSSTAGVASSTGGSGAAATAGGTSSGGNACPGCPDSDLCVEGTCYPAMICTGSDNGSYCRLSDAGLGMCCEASCVNFMSDPTNCGRCNVSCGDGGCEGWFCVGNFSCPPGTEAFNFGNFGFPAACLPTSCSANSDTTSCFLVPVIDHFTPGTCCSGACVDATSDVQNCGGCGHACDPHQECRFPGVCTPFVACDRADDLASQCELDGGGVGVCCDGACVASDGWAPSTPDNCIECSMQCVSGSSCLVDAGGAFCTAACQSDSDCPAGSMCLSDEVFQGNCAPKSCSGLAEDICAIPSGGRAIAGVCCRGGCTDVTGDPENCGACGIVCPAGQACVEGTCGGPGSSLRDCEPDAGGCPVGTACFDFFTCVQASCAGEPNGVLCAFGPNLLSLGDLGRPGTDPVTYCCGGNCSDEAVDPNNCGACGVVCPTGVCIAGRCFEPQPAASCGWACPVGSVCAGKDCVLFSCAGASPEALCLFADGGFGVCCGDSCSGLIDDPENCGGCGAACAPGQTCVRGVCSGADSCQAGRSGSYCNPDAGLGFLCCGGWGCVDVNGDPHNCGSCGVSCPSGTCVAGQCN